MSSEESPSAASSAVANVTTESSKSLKEEGQLVSKVEAVHLTHHPDSVPGISNKIESSKDGMLEAEEGELDYEEDEGEIVDPLPAKEDTPKKPADSSKEDGELEEGELNEEGEEGEILSDEENKGPSNKDVDREEGEIPDDEDIEEGEVVEPVEAVQQGRGPQRKLCRFFASGSCTWGINCRFFHPGVHDKIPQQMTPQGGPYQMPFPRPNVPSHPLMGVMMPMATVSNGEFDQPEEEGAELVAPPAPPAKETAWERGLRLAKENKKKAMMRKVEDTDFEQKRMSLGISDVADEEDGNKENQTRRRDSNHTKKSDEDGSNYRNGGSHHKVSSPYRYRDRRKRKTYRSPSSSPDRRSSRRRGGERDKTRSKDKSRDSDRKERERPRRAKPAEKTPDESGKVRSKTKDSGSVIDPQGTPLKEVKPEEPSVVEPEVAKSAKDVDLEKKDEEKSEEVKEIGEDKGKPAKSGYTGITSTRFGSDEWHDPWQRTTSPKRRSPRRSSSSYSSRSRSSSSSSSGSSHSSRSQSHTPSSGSGSRNSSRSASRSQSHSVSRSRSKSLSQSRSRSQSHSASRSVSRSRSRSRSGSRSRTRSHSPSDHSSVGSRSPSKQPQTPPHESGKEESKKTSPASSAHSSADSESESESDSGSNSSRSRSPSPSPPHAPSPPRPWPRSPISRGPPDSDVRNRRNRFEFDQRGDRPERWRVPHMPPQWDRRGPPGRGQWDDPFRDRGGYARRDRGPPRRRRSRSPPHRRDVDSRRPIPPGIEQPQRRRRSSSGDSMDHALARPSSPRRDQGRRNPDQSRIQRGSENESERGPRGDGRAPHPTQEGWSAERRKQAHTVPLTSGNVRYTGHKDIKLTLNKSASKAPARTSAPRSPPRQAEAIGSSRDVGKETVRDGGRDSGRDGRDTGRESWRDGARDSGRDSERKRWPRPPSPEPARHSHPDVTSSQSPALKTVKRPSDNAASKRLEENARKPPEPVKRTVETAKRAEDMPPRRPSDGAPGRRPENAPQKRPVSTGNPERLPDNAASRPLKRPADSVSPSVPVEVATPKAGGSASNMSSRREELLRELKAVEDAIARKRARIE
ncbi:zinc finger CCCH domain-containing protein 18 [Nematostella vectensis]|uniref:zinc finger CCCH domain-containing protein 18 n=1 Tax=Nematostella vectensis TaxID=45351 RepID=UPI00138F9FB7|nr:zinc finger CCCH domain-containing protein 18 [Nematostella vectensis]XP_048577159.1 zinc finger CCCH domain-containing protein 18 [Nematostella vectensis]